MGCLVRRQVSRLSSAAFMGQLGEGGAECRSWATSSGRKQAAGAGRRGDSRPRFDPRCRCSLVLALAAADESEREDGPHEKRRRHEAQQSHATDYGGGLRPVCAPQVSVYSGPEPPSGGVRRPPLAVIAPHWTQLDGVTRTVTSPSPGTTSYTCAGHIRTQRSPSSRGTRRLILRWLGWSSRGRLPDA